MNSTIPAHNAKILPLIEAIETFFEPERELNILGLKVRDANRLLSGNRQEKIAPDEISVDLNGTLGELVVGSVLMVGRISAHAGKYIVTNGNPINLSRYRGMQVWWLRELMNTRHVFIVVKGTEGERKSITLVVRPSLIHGETLGYCFEGRQIDLVLNILESQQGIVSPEKIRTLTSVLFGAVKDGEAYAFQDLPDDYMFKIIVGDKFKQIDLKKIFEQALHSISRSLDINLMAELLGEGFDTAGKENGKTRWNVKIAVLWRKRHEDIYKALKTSGFHVGKKDFFKIGKDLREGPGILTEGNITWVLNDDWSQGIEIALGDIDMLIGSGGMPGTLNSAWLVAKYGGNFASIPISTEYLYQGVAYTHFDNVDNFSPREKRNAKRFNFVLIDPVSGRNKIYTHQDMIKADLNESVMAVGIIRENPYWGGGIQRLRIDEKSGNALVNVLWLGPKEKGIINLELEFETSITHYLSEVRISGSEEKKAENLYHLGLAYAEFGKWRKARETIRNASSFSADCHSKIIQRNIAIAELYIRGSEVLGTGKPDVAIKRATEIFKKALIYTENEDSLRLRRFLRRIAIDKMDRTIQLAEENWMKGVEGKQKSLTLIPEAFEFWREAYKYTGHEIDLMERYNGLSLWEIIHSYHDEIARMWERKEFPEEKEQRLLYRYKKAYEIFTELRKTKPVSNYEKELHKAHGDIWMSLLLVTVFRESPPSIRNGMMEAYWGFLDLINEEKTDPANGRNVDTSELSSQFESRYGFSRKIIQAILEYRSKQNSGKITNIAQLFEIPLLLQDDFILQFLSSLVPTKTQLQEADDHLVEVETKFVRPTSLTIEEQIIKQQKQREKIQQEQNNVLDYNLEQGIFLFEAVIHAYHARELIVLGHPRGAEETLSRAIEALDRMIDKAQGYLPYVYQHKNKVNLYQEFGKRLGKIELLKKGIKALDEVLDPDKRKKRFGKNAGAVAGQDLIALRKMGELGQMIKQFEEG